MVRLLFADGDRKHGALKRPSSSSLIVERLRTETLGRPEFTLAYFYFSSASNSDTLNSYRALISSLVFQVGRSSRQCWDYLRQEHANSRKLGHPTNEQLFETLHHLLLIAGPTVIIIDALDECQSRDLRTVGEQEAMLAFLVKIYKLQVSSLHILLTSRPEKKIVRYLASLDPTRPSFNLQDDPRHQADLEAYITDRLSQSSFESWGEATREKARRALADTQKSQGMLVVLLLLLLIAAMNTSFRCRFLWIALQLEYLNQCAPNMIIQALESLPAGLDQTYRDILLRFRCSSSSIPRIRSILGLIAFSRGPVNVKEIVAAFTFNFELLKDEPFDDEVSDAEDFVLQHLPNLIEIVDRVYYGRTVQFIHFSVKEYLTDHALRDDSVPVCRYYFDQYFADIAASTLCLAAVSGTPALAPFRQYAGQHWQSHIAILLDAADGRVDATSGLSDVVERQKAATLLKAALTSFLDPIAERWRGAIVDEFTPLHWAAERGLRGHVTRLLQHYPADVLTEDRPEQPRFTPLAWVIRHTSSRAHLDVIDILLQYGADIHQSTPQGCVMHSAICAPEANLVISHLVSRGADVDAHLHGAHRGKRALHYAAQEGDVPVMRALLSHGADKEAFTDDGETPLRAAVGSDHHLAAKILLEEGAQPDLTRRGHFTPLQYATALGYADTVQELMKSGADWAVLGRLKEWGIEIPTEKLDGEGRYRMVKQIEELERKMETELDSSLNVV